MVEDQYVLGSILASVLLGFVLVYAFFFLNKKISSSSINTTTTAINGECRARTDDPDVIIVGAGVAGAALAHTLGKVFIPFHLSLWFPNFIIFYVRPTYAAHCIFLWPGSSILILINNQIRISLIKSASCTICCKTSAEIKVIHLFWFLQPPPIHCVLISRKPANIQN